jgi:hypothetical protein
MKTQEEIEQLAEKYYPPYPDGTITDEIRVLREGFIKGYSCQEDMTDKMSDLLAWYMVNKGEQYRNETLFVDVVKDYINLLNKQD